MAKRKTQIEIEYISKGLTEMSTALESLDPTRMTDSAQKALENIKQTAKGLGSQLQIAMDKGASPATIKQLEDSFLQLLQSFSKN